MSDARVMVAIRDPEHVDDLVKLACQLAKGMGAELTALNVVEVAPALPLDADSNLLDRPGKEAIERAAKVAWDAFGLTLHSRLVRARNAGAAIVEEAAALRADLLVLGYHGKHGLGEILLGSTVQYVAAHASCRVIVHIIPAASKAKG
jgi:basic amino acid/polyamine antiporter, APA family